MDYHPSAALATSPWDSIFRKIVYHSDPRTLFRTSAPDVRFDGGDDAPSAPLADPSARVAPVAPVAPDNDVGPSSGAEAHGQSNGGKSTGEPEGDYTSLKRAAALLYFKDRLDALKKAKVIREMCVLLKGGRS